MNQAAHLVHVGEAHLDGAAAVLNAGHRRGACAAVVARHLHTRKPCQCNKDTSSSRMQTAQAGAWQHVFNR